MSNRSHRRKFLKESAQTTLMMGPAAKIFWSAMINGVLSTQVAHAQTVTPRRYVGVFLFGGPTRSMYDLFLDPHASGNMELNPWMGNTYTAVDGRYTGLDYKFWNHNGMRLPWMWQFPVPSSSGGDRPMTDLLPNLFALQGINTENAGHPGSQLLHSLHSAGKVSLAALAADGANKEIPAALIGTGGISSFGWKSAKGKEIARLGGPNYLTSLMNPFVRPTGTVMNRILANESAIDSTLHLMSQMAVGGDIRAQVVMDSAVGTKSMMEKAAEPLTTIWAELLGKYTDLVRRAILPSAPLAGISDLPIGTAVVGQRDAIGTYRLNNAVLDHADLRTLIGPETLIADMAESFAITEYLLQRDLTRSVVISPDIFSKLYSSSGAVSALSHGFDEHTTGIMPVVFLNTMYFRALSACLLELIDRLKTLGIFNDTVIDMSQDFHRNPQLSGSDHGFTGKSVSFYSGAITNGPFVRGNTLSHYQSSSPGTWGAGGVNKDTLGNDFGHLKLSHMHATAAYLLRASNPVTTASSVIELNSGVLTSMLESYKLIKTR